MDKIKVGVVDDHKLFRQGLIKLITAADEGRYEVIWEAQNGHELKERFKMADRPDVILMDIDMPGMDGYESVGWLVRFHKDIPVLILSMFEKEEHVMRMVKLGVKGYLSKDMEAKDIFMALEVVYHHGFYYAGFAKEIIDARLSGNGHAKPGPALTEAEMKLVQFCGTEMTYHEIALKMNLSVKTIDGYRDTLFRKLKVKSRVGLVMYAVRNGWVK